MNRYCVFCEAMTEFKVDTPLMDRCVICGNLKPNQWRYNRRIDADDRRRKK